MATTMLEASGDYLASKGHGTLGTSLVLAVMPEAPDTMVTVYENSGNSPTMTFGSAPWAYEHPAIQIICRAPRGDYPTARDKAVAIRTLLASVTEQTISGINVMRISASGGILPMGEDSNLRPMVSINVDVTVRP